MSQGVLVRTGGLRDISAAERWRWRLTERPILWLVPLTLLLAVSYLFPAVDVVRFSFTDATLLNPDYEYTLGSYAMVTRNPDLPEILSATFVFVISSVVLQLTLGLLVAMSLYRGVQRGLWGVSFLRIVILASWIVPGVASGIIWQLMFNEASYGFLNGAAPRGRHRRGSVAVRSLDRHLVGRARQCLARHRLQHDPPLCRAARHPAQPVRGRRSRWRQRLPAVPLHHAAAASADPPRQHDPHLDLHAEHLRPDPAAHRRRPRAAPPRCSPSTPTTPCSGTSTSPTAPSWP